MRALYQRVVKKTHRYEVILKSCRSEWMWDKKEWLILLMNDSWSIPWISPLKNLSQETERVTWSVSSWSRVFNSCRGERSHFCHLSCVASITEGINKREMCEFSLLWTLCEPPLVTSLKILDSFVYEQTFYFILLHCTCKCVMKIKLNLI